MLHFSTVPLYKVKMTIKSILNNFKNVPSIAPTWYRIIIIDKIPENTEWRMQ